MITINYHLACPKCFKGTPIKHMYGVNGGVKEKYLALTEFKVVTKVEEWRIEDGHTCPVCNSSGMIVLDPDVNGEAIYNRQNLSEKCENMEDWDYDGMFIFVIKRNNTNIDSHVDGKDAFMHGNWFLKEAIKEALITLDKRPDSNFSTNQSMADFYICVTGGYDFEFNRMITRVEKFASLGFSRNEVKDELTKFAKSFNLL